MKSFFVQISITLRETNFFMIGSTDFFLSKSLYYCLRITYKYGTTNNQLGWFTTISNIFRFSSIWIISFNIKLSGVFCYTFLSVKTFHHKYLTARISIILTSFWSKKNCRVQLSIFIYCTTKLINLDYFWCGNFLH